LCSVDNFYSSTERKEQKSGGKKRKERGWGPDLLDQKKRAREGELEPTLSVKERTIQKIRAGVL